MNRAEIEPDPHVPGSPATRVARMLRGLRRCLPACWGGGTASRYLRRSRGGLARTREDVSAFKLEVARTYVPLSLIRDVDQRLTRHLDRIEQKLDAAHCAILAVAGPSDHPAHPDQHGSRAEDRT